MITRSCAFAVLVAFFGACEAPPQAPASRVYIRVLDEEKEPVPDAEIAASGDVIARTNAEGQAEVSVFGSVRRARPFTSRFGVPRSIDPRALQSWSDASIRGRPLPNTWPNAARLATRWLWLYARKGHPTSPSFISERKLRGPTSPEAHMYSSRVACTSASSYC